jgi:hypothetical protein
MVGQSANSIIVVFDVTVIDEKSSTAVLENNRGQLFVDPTTPAKHRV